MYILFNYRIRIINIFYLVYFFLGIDPSELSFIAIAILNCYLASLGSQTIEWLFLA